ncbi:hypothetical protein H7J87_26845 [Mycolicibacterium wolinskyi]|uniref:Uncharacterized protein n=1 Tax=Mycolicibacterium wolinskyi TaxID=59750 RepID=A0A1X2ES93_9MYCO|nr:MULTISPECIES: hypothetical protein [Mycolicibacterium]MCV7288952.1 hypothetical protein [Mycolicibacterium wolinskyi]MCV7296989.1 hypothetical protein [Mycolicibacterium goodii]ORX09121.1 hypothetical protein AWC31_09180 [Mycolicibacterium wolinskyi]
MTTNLILVIDIHGTIDQTGLERLRSHLGLAKQGRLSDDYDQGFGYRKIEIGAGQRINVGLYRQFDGSWILDASTRTADVGPEVLTRLRAELIDGIAAAGYEAVVRPKPTFGTSNR